MQGSGRAAPAGGESAAEAPHEREVLVGMIDATDRQIDRLIYDLYGLTAEEIAVVEGAA